VDTVLDRLSEICLALPEATREDAGRHSAFRVRGKVFAWYLDDHHGDGIVAITCKAPPGENESRVQMDPDRFYIPAYTGPRGWVGLRLDTPRVDWDEVGDVVTGSYLMTAPKRLAALLRIDVD
jgi:hypothetical protein